MRKKEFSILKVGMDVGLSLGLQVNAGHGINYENVTGAKELNKVTEFNIGHSIICRSIEYGLSEAVSTMRRLLNS
jgi:pyridoxine 5-phosphate synthase